MHVMPIFSPSARCLFLFTYLRAMLKANLFHGFMINVGFKEKQCRAARRERARLIWLLTTDKAVTSALLGKLTPAEQYDVGTLADDIAEVGALVAHLPPPDLADTTEALPSEERHALWRLVQDHERGQVLLEASENVWDDLIDEMSDRDILDALQTLDIDEQIYLVQHLPRNLTGRLLASLPAEERARVRQVMHYDKHSVGAIMVWRHHGAPGCDSRYGAALSASHGQHAGQHR